jgi:hypothetical protein
MSMQNKNLIPVETKNIVIFLLWTEEHVEPCWVQIVPYLCWQTLNSRNELNAASGWTHLQYNARHEFFFNFFLLYLAQ